MGTFSIWHWLIVLAVVLILFGGKGKISQIMGDFGKGLKSFKKGMKEEEAAGESEGEAKSIEQDASDTASTRSQDEDKAAKG
jgi:sec-independent protein translocase protein TatA